MEVPAKWSPMFVCALFYLLVFFFAEAARKLVDLGLKKGSLGYTFLIELIATAQMCTCVYENGSLLTMPNFIETLACSGIIIKQYGTLGFFITVACLLTIGGWINRGAYVSPLAPIEMLNYGAIEYTLECGTLCTLLFSTERFLVLLLAETIGGWSAVHLARNMWFYSMNYSADHFAVYQSLPCALVYKVAATVLLWFPCGSLCRCPSTT